MSDNPTVANSPTSSLSDIPVRGDEDVNGKIRQVMRLDVTTGSSEALLSNSNPMPVAIISGGGSGGTASSFGSAFPAIGTAIGAKDSGGTNMAALNLSASGALRVDGSAITQPVSGTFWQATQPVSAASLPLPSGASTEATLSTLSGKVTACNTGAVVVSSSALPSGASTAAKQPALGTAGTASADVISVQGIASMTALKVDGSGVTQPVSGTFWQATQPVSGTVSITANSAVNVAQINGVTTTMGNGVSGTGVQRVTLASDSTGQVALAAGAATIGALAANQSVNVAQMNGVATTMGNGIAGTGVQRVAIASDNTAFAVNATLQTGANVIGALTANQSVNVAQINGVAPLMGNGISGTGAQRVTLASDSTGVIATVSTVTNLAQMNGAAITMGNGIAGTGVQRVAIASDNTAIPVNPSQTTATPQTLVDLASASILSTFASIGTFTASTRVAALVNTTSVILVFSLNGGTNSHFRVFPMSKQVIDFGANGLKTAAVVSVKYDTVSPGSGNGVASIEGLS